MMTDAGSDGASTSASGLSFSVLGPLTVTRSGQQLPLGGPQQRAVLASLVVEAGCTVSRSRLADELWGQQVPRGAATTIQTYVSHLRDVLEPSRDQRTSPVVLVTGAGGYRLVVDRARIDSSVFRRRVEQGQALLRSGDRSDVAAAAEVLHAALGMWRGDALADLLAFRFASEESARLHELRLIATEAAADAELSLGHDAAVITTLQPLVRAHGLRERLHEQLMLALYRSGRQAEALEVHRALATRLVDELGIDPGPAVQALHLAILHHDQRLGPPPRKTQSADSADGVASQSSAGRAAPVVDPGPDATADPRREGSKPRLREEPPAVTSWRNRRRAVAAALGALALVAGVALQSWRLRDLPETLTANAVTELDESGDVVASVPVGTDPVAMAPSPRGVWVSSVGDDTVSKVDPGTHSVQQVLDVGDSPQALAVTGDDLWVANFGDGTVSRVNVVAGKVVDTIRVGSGPSALAAGRGGLWVANSGDNTIQRIDTTTGTAGVPVGVGDGPDGLAVDDTSVWVANGRDGSVTRVDARTGEQMSAPIRVGSGPRGIVRHGDDVWVADELSETVTRIGIPTGRAHSIAAGDGPTAVAVHRGAVWVVDGRSVLRIDPRTEATTTIAAPGAVRGMAVVDGRLWVASGAIPSPLHRGGVLRVAAGKLPGTYSGARSGRVGGIDPARVYDRTAMHAQRVVYDGLLSNHYAGADAQVLVPDLATSVPEPTDGGRTYTFILRPGIRYSTGDRLEASDVARGVKRALLATDGRPDFYADILGGRGCIRARAVCDLSRGVVADDAQGRVTFHLARPDPEFLHKLTLLVVPAPVGTPLRDLRTPLPGTGPYQIAAYVPGKKFTLTRNPHFREWSASAQPAGFVDRMTWIKVSDARAAAEAVMQAHADLAELTPLGELSAAVGSLVDRMRIQAPSRVHSTVMQETSFGVVNSSRPPFDRPAARRAFNFAVDRRRTVQLLGGPSVAVATCQLIPPSVPSYAPYCPYTRGPRDGRYHGPDLATARRLVRASGTYGARVTVTDIVRDYNPPFDAYFTKVLRQLGYRVTLRRLPNTRHNERFFYDRHSGIQVQSGAWIADFPLPSNFYDVVSCASPGYPAMHCNTSLDRRAAAATAMLGTDPGAALRIWRRINLDVTDEAALVPVANEVNWWLTSDRVGNYQGGGRDTGPAMSKLWVR